MASIALELASSCIGPRNREQTVTMASNEATVQECMFDASSTASALASTGSNSPVGMDWLCLLPPAHSSENADGTTVEPPMGTAAPNRVVWVTPSTKPSGLFVATGKWEGVVESIDEKAAEFDVRMADILRDGEDLFMTFSMDDVSPEDAGMVVPGAVFYWLVGYYDRVSGQRTRVAELKFRRLPVRRDRDLARARERAKDCFST